jgi:ribonuclease D
MQPNQVHFIDRPEQLDDVRAALSTAPVLGVDTEFVRERTFFPQPGLIQISDGRDVWLLDPVALSGEPDFAASIGERLREPGATKVLHSTGEDLEVLDLIAGAEPSPLFDTQRAAALLGWPLQTRYENLAADLLSVEFPGGLGRNNWLRRPLPQDWLDYAAADVIALPALCEELRRRLDEADRLEWLHEDCRSIVEQSRTEAHPVIRVKGAAGLDDHALERLARLAEWREREARRRDRPRGFVVDDGALLELARAEPDEREAIVAQAGHRGRPPRKGEREAIVEILAAEPRPFVRPPELAPMERAQREQVKRLQKAVRRRAEELGVEAAVLASRRDLTRWVQGADPAWLSGWRGRILDDLDSI